MAAATLTKKQKKSSQQILRGKDKEKSSFVELNIPQKNEDSSEDIFKDATTNDELQKAYSTWAYKKGMEQFCRDQGITYSSGTTDNLYVQKQKHDPRFYNHLYYYGNNTYLRKEFLEKEKEMIKRKAALKVKNTAVVTSGKSKKNKVNAVSDQINKDWKESMKDISDTFGKETQATIDQLKDKWVKNRDKAESDISKASSRLTTYGKLLATDPAALFSQGIEHEINSRDTKYTRFAKANNLSGSEIMDMIIGKYNSDFGAASALDSLSKELEEAQKNPEAAAAAGKDADYFNQKISAINEKYGLSIPAYSSETSKAITLTLEGNKRYQVAQKTKELAENLIKAQEESYTDKVIEKILQKYNQTFGTDIEMTEKLKQDIRDAIRGTKTVYFNKDKTMKELTDRTRKLLYHEFESRVNDRLYQSKEWKKLMNLDNKVDDIYRKAGGNKLDEAQKKMEKWYSMSDVDFLVDIASDLDKQINSNVKFLSKWGGTLNDLDRKMGKYGLDLQLGTEFESLEKQFSLNVANSMETQLRSQVKTTLQTVNKATKAVQEAKKEVQELQQGAKNLIKRWETTVMDEVEKQEKLVVNNIMKSVKISFDTSGIGSFKI